MLAHDVVQHALEAGGVDALAAPAVAVAHLDLVVPAAQDRLPGALGQGPPGGVHAERQLLAQGRQLTGEVLLVDGPGGDGALGQGELLVGDHELGVDLQAGPQARALRAGPVGGVEGEGTRLHLVQGQGVLVGAGPPLGEAAPAVRVVGPQVHLLNDHQAVGQPQGGLHRVGQALAHALAHDQAVHDHLDVVLELLGQGRDVVEPPDLAVHPDAVEAPAPQLPEQLGVLALAPAHHGGQDLEAGTLGQGTDLVHDLLGGLGGDDGVAHRAVLDPGAGVEQAQVVVDLGDGAHRGARVAGGGLLIDGHRRAQALDEVDVRLVHLTQELAGVGGQGLHVAALALGEDRVEGQGGLARAGQPGEDDHLLARQVQVHALEVVLSCAADNEGVVHGRESRAGALSGPTARTRVRRRRSGAWSHRPGARMAW